MKPTKKELEINKHMREDTNFKSDTSHKAG